MAIETIKRAEARAQGLFRYFSGRPCKRSHVAQRLVSNRLCVVCEAARRFANAKHKTPKGRAYHQAWYRANRERVLSGCSAYRQTDGGRNAVAAHNSNRRAAKAVAGGTHTAADLAALLAAQKHRCAHPGCGADLRKVGKHLDHIMPLSRGGSNDRRNLQYLCPHNLSKGGKDPLDFAREQGRLL